jgi:hypothetical protein
MITFTLAYSESFCLWSFSQKNLPNHYPQLLSQYEVEDCDLAHFFEETSENVSESTKTTAG